MHRYKYNSFIGYISSDNIVINGWISVVLYHRYKPCVNRFELIIDGPHGSWKNKVVSPSLSLSLPFIPEMGRRQKCIGTTLILGDSNFVPELSKRRKENHLQLSQFGFGIFLLLALCPATQRANNFHGGEGFSNGCWARSHKNVHILLWCLIFSYKFAPSRKQRSPPKKYGSFFVLSLLRGWEHFWDGQVWGALLFTSHRPLSIKLVIGTDNL